MTHDVFPPATAEMSARRKALAPATHEAFTAFSKEVFADRALPEVTKQLIAVAVAHATALRTVSAPVPAFGMWRGRA